MRNKYILITGAAGFIGYHISIRLIKEGFNIIGLDNLNNYYDVFLKKERLRKINDSAKGSKNIWQFLEGDIENNEFVEETFARFKPEIVINLAAQAGVRYSIKNPSTYINSNICQFKTVKSILLVKLSIQI